MNKEQILESDVIGFLMLSEKIKHKEALELRENKPVLISVTLDELKNMVKHCSNKVSTKLQWVQRKEFKEYYQLQDDIAVYGYVKMYEDKWFWSARVMENCRKTSDPIEGFAPTMESAMSIIEKLCEETKTFMCLQEVKE